jgi:hypothetical protein
MWALFVDSGGRAAPWMWLKALSGWDIKCSWGSASLTYLYRQVRVILTYLVLSSSEKIFIFNMCFFSFIWTMLAIESVLKPGLVVVCYCYRFGCGSTSLLVGRRSVNG